MTVVADRPATAVGSASRGLRYAAGLDGLRAIAVTVVLLFHADLPWFPGGFLGVDVFFVLSGYLITSLILTELRRTNRVDFGQFYLRRARRLLPALGVTLALAAVLALTVAPDAAERLRGDIVASLFYVSNWWYVVHDLSYFEVIGRAPLLQHLWTLAIEEQFYLVWPAVAFLLFRWGGRRRIATVAAAGALLSTIWMAYLSVTMDAPGTADVSRLYFGTDSHAMGMLAGATLATLWQMDRLPAVLGRWGRAALTGAGIVGIAGIVWFVHNVTSDTTWLYRGGFLLLALLVAPIIAAAVHPALRFGRVLGWGPMRYVGTRSYGLYLFHWPIFLVLRPEIDVPWSGPVVLVLRLAATFAVAELSYRFVEMPVRRGAIGRLWKTARQRWGSRVWPVAGAGVLTLGLLVGSVSSGLAATAKDTTIEGLDGVTASDGAGDLLAEPEIVQPGGQPSAQPSGDAAKPDGQGGKPSSTPTAPATPPDATADLTLGPITAIGDSVLLGDSKFLRAAFPKVTVDAEVSRQSGGVFSRVRARIAADRLASVVILHTGTNGVILPEQLDDTIKRMGPDRIVVLINTHVPRSWQDNNNKIIAAAAAKHKNVRLVDWAGLSAGHRDYFASDYVHMVRSGGKVFTKAIADALGGDPKRVSKALSQVP